MSRTIRRKNYVPPRTRNIFPRLDIDEENKESYYWSKRSYLPRIIRYHMDGVKDGNAPKYYRKILDSSKKMMDKQEIIRFLKDPENYDPVFVMRKKDANWWYW